MNIPRRFESLRDFVALLERCQQMQHIGVEVSADEEVAALTDRVSKLAGGGPSLFFTQVAGCEWPLVTNLFGSPERSAWALGAERLDDLRIRLSSDLGRYSERPADQRLVQLTAHPDYQPQFVAAPPCQQIVARSPFDLMSLPLLRNFPADGGGYLTLPLVFSDDPETAGGNCGIYRVQVIGPDRLVIHWRADSDGARNYHRYLQSGKSMPVAIALGGDPSMLFSAAMRLPAAIAETAFAGYLRDAPVQLARCLTSSLAVPASAELVLEGEVVPGEFHAEGPFGNHTGHYQPEHQCPVIRITSVTRRERPIIPATVVGRPPMEDCYLAKALERLLLSLLQVDHPEVSELCMPMEGIFHGCAFVAIESSSPARHQELMRELAESFWLAGSRLLVLFDREVDVHDPRENFWRALNALNDNCSLSRIGTTCVFDATGVAQRSRRCSRSPEIEAQVTRRWQEYGLEALLNGN